MGERKVKEHSDSASKSKFTQHLLKDLMALEKMLEKGRFESRKYRIGAEQELCFIDQSWRPSFINMKVLEQAQEKRFTTELAKFNMEVNLDPEIFTGKCFSKIEHELVDLLTNILKIARLYDSRIILTGILPTVRNTDVNLRVITPIPRYKVLIKTMKELKGGNFEFRITGSDELVTKHNSVMFEACNTSFQVHYQGNPKKIVDVFNWAQAVTGPVLAMATNSPLFFGKRLWHETRIALFQQSVDTRSKKKLREQYARVTFGTQWLKKSIVEIFRENIARYRVLLDADMDEEPLELVEQGKVPMLNALAVHNSTIYRWNRVCYGITNGRPHLRIENRVLPSGPTVVDEVANAAFWLGLMRGMPTAYTNISRKMEFDDAKTNFIKAAREGLNAQFIWLKGKPIAAKELILKELLPIAHKGLQKAKITEEDRDKYLGIIEQRVITGQTGSRWILDSYDKLKKQGSAEEALVATTAGIYRRQKKGDPVHTWDLASLEEVGSWMFRYWEVHQIMSTDLLTVQEDDLIDLATNIMSWHDIRHVPVENTKGNLVGLVTASALFKHYGERLKKGADQAVIKDVMIDEVITVSPDTLTIKALSIMKKEDVDCLPVVKNKKLVGIITDRDFVGISERLFEELRTRTIDYGRRT